MSGSRRQLLFFATGFLAQTAQILIIREVFLNFSGNELAFGIVFSLWLLFLAAGTLTFSSIRYAPETALLLLFLSVLLYLPVAVHLLRVSKSWIPLMSEAVIPLFWTLFYTLVIAAPLMFLCGALFSAAVRYNEKLKVAPVHRVYILDSIGDLVAGAAFSFLWALLLDHMQTLALTGLLVMLLAAIAVKGARRIVAVSAVIISCILLFFAEDLEHESQKTRFFALNPQLRLVDVASSPYGEVAVVSLEGSEQFDFYINGEYLFSTPDEYGVAQHAHTLLVLHPEPKNLLLLGGVATVLSEALLHPLKRIDCVELDPKLAVMLKRHLKGAERKALDDERVALHITDARAFVSTAPGESYDIVASCASPPLTFSANRLFTLQFFEQVKRILRKDGVFVLSVGLEPDAQKEASERTLCIVNTLAEVFEYVKVTPAGLTVASDAPVVTDPAILTERYRKRGVQSDFFDPYIYQTFFLESDQERIDAALERFSSGGVVNTDGNPVAVVKSLGVWRLLSTDADRLFFGAQEALQPLHLFIAAAVILVLGLFLSMMRRGKGNAFAVYTAVFVCGFFGMAVSITVLLLLQSTVGIAYALVGALTATFMFGIAIAAEAVHRHNFESEKALTILIAVAVALSLLLPLVIPLHNLTSSRILTGVVLFSVSFLSGCVVGAVYRIALALRKESSGSAARIYAADLLGATAGALLVGCALLLNSGVFLSSLTVSALLVASALTIVFRKFRKAS